MEYYKTWNLILTTLKLVIYHNVLINFGGIFDFDLKAERLVEVTRELEDPNIWNNAENAQNLGRERVILENIVNGILSLDSALTDAKELLELGEMEQDEATVAQVIIDLNQSQKSVEELEFRRMFSGELDANNCFLEIQSGAGGTEAQDWASMVCRMYIRWGDAKGFKVEVLEESAGDVAGLKSASLKFEGEYAYGWLRSETGVHRLVRKSPFDSSNRRHTSFCSVFISPEVDDKVNIEINPADLRIDVYRAQGAGGQHINKTESAVRITHIPTNTVTQCQNDRSQHRNKDSAMNQLKSKLYELEMQKRRATSDALEDSKADVGWGSQIRSYVLDQSRIKDLRTGYEVGNTQAVLDGDLDGFIEASLKSGY